MRTNSTSSLDCWGIVRHIAKEVQKVQKVYGLSKIKLGRWMRTIVLGILEECTNFWVICRSTQRFFDIEGCQSTPRG